MQWEEGRGDNQGACWKSLRLLTNLSNTLCVLLLPIYAPSPAEQQQQQQQQRRGGGGGGAGGLSGAALYRRNFMEALWRAGGLSGQAAAPRPLGSRLAGRLAGWLAGGT
eukprot:COSAG01_NODE_5129_length_4468_cov_4.222477_5_plen_109_part_00